MSYLQMIGFNFALGTVIAFFVSPYYYHSFFFVLFVCQIITQIIGTSVELFFRAYEPPSLKPRIIPVLYGGCVAFAASALAFVLIKYAVEPMAGFHIFLSPLDYFTRVSLPASVIAMGITFIELEKKIGKAVEPAKPQNEKPDPNRETAILSLRSAGEYRMVQWQEITYLSANGAKTVVHTKDDEIECDHLLKELLERLPPQQFMRVHKKYGVNLDKIARVQYLAGGSYLAHLNDDDDTQVTIGRAFASKLKSELHIS